MIDAPNIITEKSAVVRFFFEITCVTLELKGKHVRPSGLNNEDREGVTLSLYQRERCRTKGDRVSGKLSMVEMRS